MNKEEEEVFRWGYNDALSDFVAQYDLDGPTVTEIYDEIFKRGYEKGRADENANCPCGRAQD